MQKESFHQAPWNIGRRLVPVFVAAGLAAGCAGEDDGNALTVSEAHRLCAAAITAAVPNSTQVEIPLKAERETVRVISFTWRIGDGLKIPDQQGVQHDAPVICRASKEQREVVFLEINGKTVMPQ